MRKIKSLGLVGALYVISFAFMACSKNDGEGVEKPSSSKRIVKINVDKGSYVEETSFQYDSQGRLISEEKNWNTHSDKTTYTYNETSIIKKLKGDMWTASDNFTLSNGRIIRDVDESETVRNYTYDDSGYLIKQTFENEAQFNSGTIQFEWSDGNLIKYTKTRDEGSSTVYTITYSDISWPKNFFIEWDGTNIEAVLEPMGAFGKMPRYLPQKISLSSGREYTIDYTMVDGYVTKYIIQTSEKSEIYTLVWE